MAKQIDFVTQIHNARKRVSTQEGIVQETRHLYDNAVKMKMTKTAERLKGTLRRQETALAHAQAELAEWENAK